MGSEVISHGAGAAARQLAQDGGAKLVETLGARAVLEDWGALAARPLGKGMAEKSGG